MKFVYQYKTSDGVRHDGVFSAPSEKAVYGELKRQGVKPFNVRLAPGLFNRVQSLGKRGLAILALVIVAVALAFSLRSSKEAVRTFEESQITPLSRHHIYGDPALIEEMRRTSFESVFADPGERMLACYAQPGVVASVSFLPKSAGSVVLPDLSVTLAHEVEMDASDVREVREIKRIVLWMKDELRHYLSDGVGTPESYFRRLNERQREELAILHRVRQRINADKTPDALRRANEALRSVGLETIVPDEESAKKSGGENNEKGRHPNG